MNLLEAKLNLSYVITKVSAKPPLSYRLLSLGFVCGAPITLFAWTFARQTFHVKTGSTVVALRKEEAKAILIEESSYA